MQLDRHIEQVHSAMRASAALGDERTRQVAETLAAAATPAVRLAILGALGDAADEITAALLDAPGAPAVGVRLDADDVRIVVAATQQPAEDPQPERSDGGEASARISLRLSESLKSDIDAAADRDGVSVNTWLVRLAGAAISRGRDWWPDAADLAAGLGAGRPAGGGRRGGHNPHHISGWIDG